MTVSIRRLIQIVIILIVKMFDMSKKELRKEVWLFMFDKGFSEIPSEISIGVVNNLIAEFYEMKQNKNGVNPKPFECDECEDTGVGIHGMDCTSCDKKGL